MKNYRTVFAGIILIIASIAFVNSCKNSTDPEPTEPTKCTELFPLSIGNYWVFNGFTVDKDYHKSHASLDSFVVASQFELAGRNAWVLEHYIDNNLKDSILFSVSDDEILRYYPEGDTINKYFAPCWLTICKRGKESLTDNELSNWHLLPFFDTIIKTYVQTSTSFLKDFDSIITFNGTQYNTSQFKQNCQYSEAFWDTINHPNDTLGRGYISFRKSRAKVTYYNFQKGMGLLGLKYVPVMWKFYFNNVEYFRNRPSWNEYTDGKIYSIIRYKVN
jgi:hypothetical protein